MITSRSCIKCLKSACEIVFYCIWGWLKVVEVVQLVDKIAVSPRCSIKEVFWKTSHNSQINTRSSHPEVFCQRKDVLQNVAKFTEKHLFRSLFFNKVASWKPETIRSSHWRCSVKQGALKNLSNFTGNNLCWSLLLIKLHFWCLQLYQKRHRHWCLPVKFPIILKNIWECLLVKFI